jgi:hypothetical protein
MTCWSLWREHDREGDQRKRQEEHPAGLRSPPRPDQTRSDYAENGSRGSDCLDEWIDLREARDADDQRPAHSKQASAHCTNEIVCLFTSLSCQTEPGERLAVHGTA